MGWTSTAPKLSTGYYPTYTRVGSGGRKENYVSVSIVVDIARLDYDQVSIRFTLSASAGSSGNYYPPGWVNFQVGTVKKSYGWDTSLTRWWTGTLADGNNYKIKAGASSSSSSPYDHATYISDLPAEGPDYILPVYTIAYYSNNGAGSTATQGKTWGYAVSLYQCGWTKAGHTFAGYNTASDGSGTWYSGGQAYSTDANLTLYAIWSPNTFAVTYNGNGSTGGSTSGQTKTYGVNLTLRGNGYTKTGHHFLRWNTKADGTGTSYAAGGTYTANAAVTLYAIWEPDTYTVNYNGNGATGGSTAAQTKTYGKRLVLNACGFTRSSYIFTGWNTAADGTGTAYAAEGYYEANAAATLYAQWLRADIPVYLNISGTIRQVQKAYMNVSGAIRECDVYMNVNGTIVQIK